nr:unnamed protein product [Spirometra erinaceieuropaei]
MKQACWLNRFHLSCLRWILKLRWQDRIPDTDLLEWTIILSICAMLGQLQMRWRGHLVRLDNDRLPKQLFYGDVVRCPRRQGGQVHRYKDSLKTSVKHLQVNPANCEDFARDRPISRRTMKTGTAIYDANRITASKDKRETRKSQLRPPLNANAQLPPTCPPCQQTVRAPVGLVAHVRINCTTWAAPNVGSPSTFPSPSMPLTNSDRPSEPLLAPSSSSFSSPSSSFPLPSFSSTFPFFSNALTSAVLASILHFNTAHNPDTPSNANFTIDDTSGANLDYTCPNCGRTFTSNLGLVGHLQIHRTEIGEPMPGSPTYTRCTRFQCPHCPRTFINRIGLFGHMRIHES